MTISGPAGSEETKQFYDHLGWRKQDDGQVADLHLFGVKEDGPIRKLLYGVHTERIRSALQQAGEQIKLLECGCGGSPAVNLLDLCSEYTGVDFSETGLEVAREKTAEAPVPCAFQQADACKLPFDEGQFDAVYSAHMIYHIPDSEAQKIALQEMMRVVRPGGVLVLITANPRPLLFPVRFLKRLVADSKVIGYLANAIRRKPALPYQPMPLSWTRRQLSSQGDVQLIANDLASTAFNQKVTEYGGFGKLRWRFIQWLDLNHPRMSAYLGNYVQFTVVKSAQAPT